MILMVDNYDSFTYNLVQAIACLHPDVRVVRNDAFDVEEEIHRRPDRIVISPGPGRPEDAGNTIAMIRAAERERIPLLGVCLGHQAIAVAHGATVARAPAPVHGKTSQISHTGADIFAGLSNPFEATRYHSLVVEESTIPGELAATARSEDRLVMGLRHTGLPVFGVQFHPESILSLEGPKLIANFLRGNLA
jgi:anthranilate synthase component II